MAVAEKVKQIIVEQLGVDESQVDPSASFVDDLGADSLDIVELVMAFEEAFDLEFSHQEWSMQQPAFLERLAQLRAQLDKG